MLTPVDIENKEFTKTFRGYDVTEVEEFMRSLVADYERLYRSNADLKEKNATLNDTIGTYRGMEETMQNAILAAQRTAEDIKKTAYERAEVIVKDAERRAAEAIGKANAAIAQLEKTYLFMQGEMNGFKAKMNALLATYMQLLSEMPERPAGSQAFQALQNAAQEEPITAPPAAPVVTEDSSLEDTNTFSMPSAKENSQGSVSSETETDVKVARKTNPLVEELLQQKKREQEAQEAPAVTKQTVDKEVPEGITSINLEDLEDFDVFSDNDDNE